MYAMVRRGLWCPKAVGNLIGHVARARRLVALEAAERMEAVA